MKKYSFIIASLISVMLFSDVVAAQSIINLKKAAAIFNNTRALCKEDNGILWGVSLDIPLLFLDTNNHFIVANQADIEGYLQKREDVFVGPLPREITITKGVVNWGGKRWGIILWPISDDYREQQFHIIHESFHSLQPKLKLTTTPYYNGHMEEMEARIWLKLELQALELAILSDKEERKQAITDAIIFRKYRRAIFTACEGCENRFEIHEGMAEYTSLKICLPPDKQKKYLIEKIRQMWDRQSVVDYFAYCTGPIYGYLLDSTSTDWRTNLRTKDNLADIIQKAYNIKLPQDIYMEAEERSVLYQGPQIMGEELNREIKF